MVVVDETLLETVDVTAWSKEGEAPSSSIPSAPAAELRPLLHDYKGRVFTVDAGAISRKLIRGLLPQHPHVGRHCGCRHCVDPEDFLRDMESSYRHKFAKKPQVVQGNLDCLAEAMKEVKE